MMINFRIKLQSLKTLGVIVLSIGITAMALPAWSQVREKSNAVELPAEQNKALLDGLIKKIERESQDRLLKTVERGEALSVQSLNGQPPIIATLDRKTLYLLDKDCSDLSEISNWSLLFYSLVVDSSAEVDARTPINLKAVLKKNGSLIKFEQSTYCMSYVDLPNAQAFKIVGYKDIDKQRSWLFEKNFAAVGDYHSMNRISASNALAPKGAVICKIATRLCYSNTRKRDFIANLTSLGLKGDNLRLDNSSVFYLETRRSPAEISTLFPKFDIKTLTLATSNISSFISDNLKHTIVLSVRDNAMGRLKESDILTLSKLGVDLSGVDIRGAHVSILRPANPALNMTDNEKPVSVSAEDHNIPFLGDVYSAGFAMGDNSIISLAGENISPNMRGINIAVIDSKGRLVASKNFDTHISPNRSLGLYKVSVAK